MSRNTIRACAGLVLALSLAAFAGPATVAGSEDRPSAGAVHSAAANDAVIVGPVDESAVRSTGTLLSELGDRIAAEAAAAEQARDLEALAAAEDAAKLERLAAAIEAEKLARLAAAIEANEAREEEQRRAAAVASAPAGSLESIIQRHFGSAAPTAIRIADCESSMNPNARSATNDHGLFQINIVHRGQFEAVTGAPWSSVYDAELNTIYARHLYAQQGWGPWTCAG
jgi:Transglycosylase SLT domain